MDTEFFRSFYNLGHLNQSAPGIAVFFATYLPYILAAGLLVYLFFYHAKGFLFQRRLFIVASTLLSSIIAYIGILLLRSVAIDSQRPFVTFPDVTPLVDTGKAFQSFPSLHTALFFAGGMFLYFYHKRLGILYIVSALFIGIARIIAGVHWPLDIVVGALMGVASAFVVRWFTLSIKRNL